MQRMVLLTILLLLPLFTGGCTAVLWQKNRLDAYNRPSLDPRLRLYHSNAQKDFLVIYDEFSERRGLISTRAYFLYKNDWRVNGGRKPFFEETNIALIFSPTPVFQNPPVLDTNSSNQLFAIFTTNSDTFAIYSGQRVVSSHHLPNYPDAVGNVERVALTPLAVSLDVTIIGGVIFFEALTADQGALDYSSPRSKPHHK